MSRRPGGPFAVTAVVPKGSLPMSASMGDCVNCVVPMVGDGIVISCFDVLGAGYLVRSEGARAWIFMSNAYVKASSLGIFSSCGTMVLEGTGTLTAETAGAVGTNGVSLFGDCHFLVGSQAGEDRAHFLAIFLGL